MLGAVLGNVIKATVLFEDGTVEPTTVEFTWLNEGVEVTTLTYPTDTECTRVSSGGVVSFICRYQPLVTGSWKVHAAGLTTNIGADAEEFEIFPI